MNVQSHDMDNDISERVSAEPPGRASQEEEEVEEVRHDGGRDVVPLSFCHRARYHLDSCSGTNKSQNVAGGIGLLATMNKIDCCHILYMVVGHTKFGPDLVARAIAGKYHKEDTFNHGQMNGHISKFTSEMAFDGDTTDVAQRHAACFETGG